MKNLSKKLILLSATIVICALPGCAARPKANLDACDSLLAQELNKEAAECYMPAANAGDPKAQYHIGNLYLNASGGADKDIYVEKMFRKSAEQGYPEGQMGLGDLYALGIAVPKSEQEALKWYTKAGEQDLEAAQLRLGNWYNEGTGTQKNEETSLKWYKRAAEKGSAAAASHLSNYYYMEKKDYKEGKKWIEKAAQASDRLALMWLGSMYRNGLGVQEDKVEAFKWYILFNKVGPPDPAGRPEAFVKELSAQQISEANDRANEWMKHHPLKLKE
jgi:TPR repeat protein